MRMQTITISLRLFLWFLLFACMAVLTKNILFKTIPNNTAYTEQGISKRAIKKRWEEANFQPSKSVRFIYRSNIFSTEYKVENILGNIIGFVPLGILLPLLFAPLKRGWLLVAFVGFISLAFETTQILFGLGIFDVDDIILNTAGGLAGYIVYWMVRSFVRSKNYQQNTAL
jgi:glycopeptide antibiotics resistance protein